MSIYPQLLLDVHDELIVDLFAGGGGASCGIEMATGRQVDVATTHDTAQEGGSDRLYLDYEFLAPPRDTASGRWELTDAGRAALEASHG